MIIEIDLNLIIEKSISVAMVLTCVYVVMPILYGRWPWQSGPKQRNVVLEESGLHNFVPLSEAEREKMSEPTTEGVLPVAAASLQPLEASVDTNSYPASIIKTDEE